MTDQRPMTISYMHEHVALGYYKGELTAEQAYYAIYNKLPSRDTLLMFQNTLHELMRRYIPEYNRAVEEELEDELRFEMGVESTYHGEEL